MAPARILLKNGCVLSLDRNIGNYRNADVLIEGSKIAAVGPNLSAADAEAIDASNMIVMPGFVDSHRHVWEGILRNIATDCPLEGDASYLAFILNTLAPVYRPEDAYVGDLVGLLGAIDAGITTILDWSHIQATREHADAVIRALQESGMRAVFAYGYPWWKYPDEHQDEWIRDVAKQYFSSKDQLLTFGIAPPGPEFTPFEVAQSQWQLARDLDAHLTVHVGVGSAGQHGKLGEMGKAGLLGPDTTYIHCTTLSDDEIQMIVDTGGTFSLASPVEMMMGHGMPPTQRFLDRGLRPSLSIDVETNVPNDMFTQMRSVISLQHALLFDRKLQGMDNVPTPLTTRDLLEFATIEGARANGLAEVTGSLTPGKEADVILLSTDRPNIFPINDPIGAVVWGMDTGNVDSVFVAGKALKRGGKLLGVDLDRVRKMAYESRDYVVAQSGFKLPEISAGGGEQARARKTTGGTTQVMPWATWRPHASRTAGGTVTETCLERFADARQVSGQGQRMRNLTEANLTDAVIAAMADGQDQRTRTILSGLVRHLHGFIQEVSLTEAEWLAGIQFLTATGEKTDEKRQEFILLSDTLGATTMKDIINNRKPPGATEYTILGPFHRADAPEMPLFSNMAGAIAGPPMLVRGRVLASHGSPIPGATLDVWQADAKGNYDLQMPGLAGTALRGVFRTDAEGRFGLRTIKPSYYPIPDDGPVGQMLKATGRHPYRPAHVHFIVSGDGHQQVTTELFEDGDPYLDSDAVFGVRESLVVPFVRHDSAEEAAVLGVTAPFYTLDYDFVLAPA